MDQLPLTLPQPPLTQRRGRPRGSGNKRSTDLAKYVAARFGGMTPGQQAAEVCMVSRAELAAAKPIAKSAGQPAMLVAMAIKANALAGWLNCDARDAMLLIQKAQAELLPYVHQKLPPAEAPKGGAQLPTVFMIPDDGAQTLPSLDDGHEQDALDFIEVSSEPADQVSQTKSHDNP